MPTFPRPGYAPCGCYVGAWHGVTPPPRCAGHSEPVVLPRRTFTSIEPSAVTIVIKYE